MLRGMRRSDVIKVLISSRSFGKINSGAIDLLKKNGLEPILNPYGKKLSEKEIIDLLDDSVGIIAGTEEITEKIINEGKKLKIISRYGIGLDNVDLKAANKKNILVFNTPETPTIAVAELTVTLILCVLKKIVNVDKNMKQNNWKPKIGNLISKKNVGIIGLGRIGKKVVEFLNPYDVKILSFELKPDKEFCLRYNVQIVEFDELIKKSDIITLHCPLNDKTKNLISEKELKNMKKTAILINTARGSLVNEGDLYKSLKNKEISGAALDVFENEPDTGKLKDLDNIILTPHIGTFTIETRRDMEIEAAKNLIKGLKR